ncbi:MAG: hypothetical protein ACFE0Q_16040 [Anaerolineae bacterium]
MLLLIIVLFAMTACQPVSPAGPATDIPFPTMTVGQRVSGALSTPNVRSGLLPGQVSNPQDSALINRTTPTPDSSRCPFASEDATLDAFPDTRIEAINQITQFLNDGGQAEALQRAILSEWDTFGEAGFFETIDLTGEGTPEIIIGYTAPGDVGTMLVFGCQAGQYVQLYENNSDGIDPPALLSNDDLNNSSPVELVIVRRVCVDPQACELQTQIVSWSYQLGRFVSLLADTVRTIDPPELRDIDNDLVDELVINLNSNGTTATGPLRQGTIIYDWDGELYVRSIIQLREPSYRIQVIHEGDRLFSLQRVSEAIQAYNNALTDDDLRYWFNDGPVNTLTYAQYRLILAYGFLGDSAGIITTLDTINSSYPLEEEQTLANLPVYAHMANAFVQTLSEVGDLHEACLAVQEIISERDEALGFINRYGNRNPTYSALDLCPY